MKNTDRQKIAKLYQSGLSLKQVEKLTGINFNTVLYTLKSMEVPRRRVGAPKGMRPGTIDKYKEVVALYQEVGSLSAVARHYKVSRQRISTILNLYEKATGKKIERQYKKDKKDKKEDPYYIPVPVDDELYIKRLLKSKVEALSLNHKVI